MKNLHKYLVEKFELTRAVDFIQDVIDKPEENQQSIRAAYYAISKEEEQKFEQFCTDRGIPVPSVSGSIWNLFKRYESTDLLLDVINGDKIPVNEITKSDKVDLVAIINNHYDVSKVNPNLVKDLFKLTFIMNGIAVGPGEFFFSMFVDGCEKTSKGADLQINGVNTELKGAGAKFHGMTQPKTANLIKNLDNYNAEHGTQIKAGKKVSDVRGTFGDVENIAEFTSTLIGYDMSGNAIKDSQQLFPNDYGYSAEYLQFLNKNKNMSAEDWLLSIEVYALKIYSESENFGQIMIFNSTFANNIPVTIVDVTQSIDALFKFFKKIKLEPITGMDANDAFFLLPKVSLKK